MIKTKEVAIRAGVIQTENTFFFLEMLKLWHEYVKRLITLMLNYFICVID